MLVWLASYPRSGNHLLRMILNRCFELHSYSIYQPSGVAVGRLAELMGVRRFEGETAEPFVAAARSSAELTLVKTHEPVPDSDRCIYIVRDARAALVSYQKYQGDIVGQPCELSDVITGKVWPGHWQDHVSRFLRRDPENTLILRYEELASDTPPLDRMAAFLGVPVVRPFDIAFSELRELDGKKFSTGHNRVGIETIERDHGELFWDNCGTMMRTLGYRRPRWRSLLPRLIKRR